jgi:hypothetical protein
MLLSRKRSFLIPHFALPLNFSVPVAITSCAKLPFWIAGHSPLPVLSRRDRSPGLPDVAQATFQFSVSLSSSRVRAQKVTEQERISLVGSPLHTHMSIGGPLTWRRAEIPLFPLGPSSSKVRWAMITPVTFNMSVTESSHCCDAPIIEKGMLVTQGIGTDQTRLQKEELKCYHNFGQGGRHSAVSGQSFNVFQAFSGGRYHKTATIEPCRR